MMSEITRAPVASSERSCDRRMITTDTFSSDATSSSTRSAAPKKRAPSRRTTAIRSSPGSATPGTASRVTLLERASSRNAMTAAAAMPMSTAMMRSNEIVTIAVMTKMAASARVERTMARTVAGPTMRTAVTMSTPARAARGMPETRLLAAYTTMTRTRECTIAESRERPPLRTFTAVRAIAPVAGMPPKKPAAMDASPWPTSSRSASTGPVGASEAATRADSSDSIAASAATATAGPSSTSGSTPLRSGSPGAGKLDGSGPMVSTGASSSCASAVTTTIAMRDPGRCRCSRGSTTMMTTTSRVAPTAQAADGQDIRPNAVTAATTACGSTALVTPRAAGICCAAMMIAMPSVKPSITGHGM